LFGVLTLIAALTMGGAACAGKQSQPPAAPSTSSNPTAASTPPPAPRDGAWQAIAAAPAELIAQSGVWTGSELILHTPNYPTGIGSIDLAYMPSTDTWRRLPPNRYPVVSTEAGSQAVWDGTELLTFGVQNAALNPSTGRWRPLAAPPVAAPSVVAWTGSEVLMWGGGCCDEATNVGATYDPRTNRWAPMPPSPLAGRHADGVWTRSELIVVGGQAYEDTFFRDAAAYNPVSRAWRMLPPLPAPRLDASLTWTGRELLVVGGQPNFRSVPYADGWAYRPSDNAWHALPPMPLGRTQHGAVWTGQYLIVWGGETRATGTEPYRAPPNGLIYDPSARAWLDLPKAPIKARIRALTFWAADRVLIWGGQGIAEPYPDFVDGATYAP
jgi:hypothetical protein